MRELHLRICFYWSVRNTSVSRVGIALIEVVYWRILLSYWGCVPHEEAVWRVLSAEVASRGRLTGAGLWSAGNWRGRFAAGLRSADVRTVLRSDCNARCRLYTGVMFGLLSEDLYMERLFLPRCEVRFHISEMVICRIILVQASEWLNIYDLML